jgi:hypothetical protein
MGITAAIITGVVAAGGTYMQNKQQKEAYEQSRKDAQAGTNRTPYMAASLAPHLGWILNEAARGYAKTSGSRLPSSVLGTGILSGPNALGGQGFHKTDKGWRFNEPEPVPDPMSTAPTAQPMDGAGGEPVLSQRHQAQNEYERLMAQLRAYSQQQGMQNAQIPGLNFGGGVRHGAM